MEQGRALPAERFQPAFAVAIMAAAIFLAAMLGIVSRPTGLLASFWPANAVMLGMLLRYPRLATSWVWIGAIAAFLTADIITGSELELTVWLTLGNIVAIGGAWLPLRRLPEAAQRLRTPDAMLYIVAGSALGAAMAGLLGIVIGAFYFDMAPLDSWTLWFASELASFVAIVPVILSMPPLFSRERPLTPAAVRAALVPLVIPIIMMAVALAAGLWVGGPAAFAFTFPALLWCALRVGVFQTAVLTLLSTIWLLVFFSQGWLDVGLSNTSSTLTSLRLALVILATGPVAVACSIATHNELQQRLAYVASHDSLTGALTRGAFLAQADTLWRRLTGGKVTAAVVMFDLDQFKQINDVYGHAAGDAVLTAFAGVVSSRLGAHDIFGRLGGEEFALLLAAVSPDEALARVDAMRIAFAVQPLDATPDRPARTVSAGIVLGSTGSSLTDVLALADEALYQAKNTGRNTIRLIQPGHAYPAAA